MPSSTVTLRWLHAWRSSRTIKYASITTSTCPRVLASVRTYHGRNSKWAVLQVRNACSTSAKSLYRSCTTGADATVQTNVAGKAETRVDYRMHLRNGRWLVYDVLIGGVSIIDNFRSQLHRLLRDVSYAGMIEKLREATGGQAAPRPR